MLYLTTLCGVKLLNPAFPIQVPASAGCPLLGPLGGAVGQSLDDDEEAPLEDLPWSLLWLTEHWCLPCSTGMTKHSTGIVADTSCPRRDMRQLVPGLLLGSITTPVSEKIQHLNQSSVSYSQTHLVPEEIWNSWFPDFFRKHYN